MGGWTIGLEFTLRGKRRFAEEGAAVREIEGKKEREDSRRRAWSYPLYCAHFCRLPDRLKGLGCTIPFIHCSPGLLLSDTATPPCVVTSHFPFARLLRRFSSAASGYSRPSSSSSPSLFESTLSSSLLFRFFFFFVSHGQSPFWNHAENMSVPYRRVVQSVLFSCLHCEIR